MNIHSSWLVDTIRHRGCQAAKERKDCDIVPTVERTDLSHEGFILVDIKYSSKGYCALYEYRLSDGKFYLAQD